jgi:hypothetical protein
MLGKLLGRKNLLLFFIGGLLFLGSSTAQAQGQMSLHVLFTGDVKGRLEPSG